LCILLQPLKLRRNALEVNIEQKFKGIDLNAEPEDEESGITMNLLELVVSSHLKQLGYEMLEKVVLSSALLVDRLTKIFILLKCELSQTKDPVEIEVLRLIVKKIDKVF